ncbi:MAG: acyltransferase [Pseudomonadota bacterium]|nr:acyltransferase [Pseudomonadota bacterium]
MENLTSRTASSNTPFVSSHSQSQGSGVNSVHSQEAIRTGHGAKTYRPDIDGLRAVAVLPVVAYHAGIHLVRGGFVGVDIFFVISGYLITQVLSSEIQSGRFSILRFYERRIRRILPALVVMLLATSLLGLMYCAPSELIDLSKSTIAAALSVSNIYFWLNAGYFDSPALAKPLLHTWSLAVEEQFYIVWPVFLILAHRYFKRRVVLITVVIGLISFAASAIGAFNDPNSTFYLVHTRIWELALGGALALGAVPTRLGAGIRNLLSAVGLVLIVGSVFMIDSSLPFPGILAVPPCLGAALIILAGGDGTTVVGETLSWRPLRVIGLISYSLYLWHWPLTVFQKNYAVLGGGVSERANKCLIIGVSMLMAFISWKFIEQPFRTGKFRPSEASLLRWAAIGIGVVLVSGAVGWAGAGFPGRFSSRELQIASYLRYDGAKLFRDGRCFLSGRADETRLAPECLLLDATRKNYLLLGDSHAAQLWSGLNSTFTDINFLQATSSDCFPTVEHSLTESSRCTRIVDDVFFRFLTTNHVDRVVLVARWKTDLTDEVSSTLKWMKRRGIPVTLVGPTVVYDLPYPQLLINASRKNDPSLPDRYWDRSLEALDHKMSMLSAEGGVEYISLLDLMCSKNSCTASDRDGMPLISDREHLTADGALLVAGKLKRLGFLQ